MGGNGPQLVYNERHYQITFCYVVLLSGTPKLTLLGLAKNIPRIKVTFADGTEDLIALEYYNRKKGAASNVCAFSGHLKNEPQTSAVSATGCLHRNETLDLMIVSQHTRRYTTFTMTSDGSSQFVELKDNFDDVEAVADSDNQTATGYRTFRQAKQAPFRMKAKIRFFYDNTAKRRLEKGELNATTMRDYIDNVMPHLQLIFKDTTLSHQIVLEVAATSILLLLSTEEFKFQSNSLAN